MHMVSFEKRQGGIAPVSAVITALNYGRTCEEVSEWVALQ